MKVPAALHPGQHLLSGVLDCSVSLTILSVGQRKTVVLICISPKTTDVKHLFMFPIHVSSWVKIHEYSNLVPIFVALFSYHCVLKVI